MRWCRGTPALPPPGPQAHRFPPKRPEPLGWLWALLTHWSLWSPQAAAWTSPSKECWRLRCERVLSVGTCRCAVQSGKTVSTRPGPQGTPQRSSRGLRGAGLQLGVMRPFSGVCMVARSGEDRLCATGDWTPGLGKITAGRACGGRRPLGRGLSCRAGWGSARLDAPGTKDVAGAQRQVRVAGGSSLGGSPCGQGLQRPGVWHGPWVGG